MRPNLETSTGPTGTAGTTGTNRRTPRALAALALAGALVLGACSTGDAGSDSGAGATSAPDAASSTAPDGASGASDQAGATAGGAGAFDTAALPDPVAEVNGEEISREDFVSALEQQQTAAEQQAQAGGAPVDQQALADSVLETLVSSTLFTQEGKRLGLEASAKEIDAELDSVAEENGLGSRDELLDLLAEQGVEEKEVREEVGRVLMIDEVLAERGQVKPPSDQELRDYYDELTAGQDNGAAATAEAALPAFDEIKGQLADQMTQEKENEALSTILEQLEKDAEITRHL